VDPSDRNGRGEGDAPAAPSEREAALRASEERFRIVARVTNDAIWEMDLETLRVEHADNFAAIFGYRPEDVGEDVAWWYQRIHPDDRARVDATLAAWRASGDDTCVGEYRFRRADGTWAHVFDRGMMMRDAAGRPVRFIGAMMDVSERKQMEAKLAVADRLAALGTLAAGVAHEINNPLSYVIANVRIVEERLRKLAGGLDPSAGARPAPDPADPAALREALTSAAAALDEAREGAERVHRIVADLKAFAGAEEERRSRVDVRRALEAALNLAEHEVRRRARLVRDLADVPPVLANEARLGQVFLTLVVNAAESIPAGDPAANEVRVSARRDDGGRAVIEVRDTGPGLGAEARGRIFDPFFSVRASGERAGLGLSICHAIVTAFGGEVQVDSELGRGTCFRVVLPAAGGASAQPTPPPAAPSRPPAAPRPGRILVVDDEPMVGRMVERALGHAHRIASVTSGKDALARLVAGERFDVILCDLMMPSMSGMDLHERVLALDPDQAERMVFLSGGAFTPRAREFLARHPSLEKPFDLRALEAAIEARIR
jgi:PAS domain S-box-containing protein